MTAYVIISPVRNEELHLQKTIDSIAGQTCRPVQWIIVDDGSTDRTAEIAGAATSRFPWITVLHRPDRGFRKAGGGVMEAFYDGYELLAKAPWEFLVKLDGDLSFDPDYFERCFDHFASDQKLGIGGGTICGEVNGELVEEAKGDPAFHVRGATKIYRKACWDGLGGLLKAPGWDTLDEVKANMLGWKTYSFKDLHLLQLKPTGAADGSWKNWFKNGQANYIAGYHPLFMLSKCARRTFKKPFLIGSCGLLFGYLQGHFKRIPQVPDPELIRYLRKQQVSRLLFQPSLWRY